MRKSFLEYVAEDIINKYGTNLSRIAVVFPNKRAALYLNEFLAQKAQCPIWAPIYMTISELFNKYSDLIIGDQIKLICEAYKSFIKYTGIDETLDHFWSWGQLLIADFDDIDKNMADVSKVFANVKDFHELDDISYLTEEQKSIICKFFSNFIENNNTELKKRFLQLWCHIEDIYNDFRSRIYKENIAYEGMLYREVAEKKIIHDNKIDMYLFVGFNVIQKVEQHIFSLLQKDGKAHFYWDFDQYYMPKQDTTTISNEAGHYISNYMTKFSNELDSTDKNIYCNFFNKNITFASASTENIQARYINKWLKNNCKYKDGRKTAIVLCNEELLPSIIHYIPDEVDKVNITTGFPLFQTTIFSFVTQLIDLRINGYSTSKNTFKIKYVLNVLSHPYAQYISKQCIELKRKLLESKIYYPTPSILSADNNLKIIFCNLENSKPITQWILAIFEIITKNHIANEMSPLNQEALFKMYTLFNRINELIISGDLTVDEITLQKIIIQLINSTSIPFHGEPVEGVQIMGILETRNLDFDHILLLSCNEGYMPKGINDSSFIPYSIRKAYGLTTIDNKVSIYAYYFYNLIQRANDVTIVYNNSTENGHTGEMSRFMLQLLTESNFNIKRISLQAEQNIINKPITEIIKSDKIISVLDSIDNISPTSINRYMRCQLQFYYNNIAQIKEPDDDQLEDMSNRIFGNVFHSASEKLYKILTRQNKTVNKDAIEYALKHREMLERVVDEAFCEILFKIKNHTKKHIEYNGLQLINREVIIIYLRRLLEIDKSLAPFIMIDIESSLYMKLEIKTSVCSRVINIGGRIDRLDQIYDKVNQSWRIRLVDYKTGRQPAKKINTIDEIFKTPIDRGKHADYILQTMLYATTIRHHAKYNASNLPVSPALLYIQNMSDNDDPTIKLGKERVLDIANYEKEFNENLKNIISDIFEPQNPFTPTKDRSICEHCPYLNLCRA